MTEENVTCVTIKENRPGWAIKCREVLNTGKWEFTLRIIQWARRKCF